MSTRLIPYYGGKIRMVDKISMLIPENKVMYELFGGSGALTLNYNNGGKQVLNEWNPDIYCLWKVVKDRELGAEFKLRLCTVKYSRKRFMEAKRHKDNNFNGLDEVSKAVEVFVLVTQSYNSLMEGYSCKNTDGYAVKNVTSASRVYHRMANIEISNRDAIKMVHEMQWGADDFLFLDPPYRLEYRAGMAYDYEMEDDKHKELLQGIKDAECKIMLCGYRDENGKEDLYDKILGESSVNEWKCYLLTNIQKPDEGKEFAEEYIWVNYDLPSRAKRIIDMDSEIICKEQDMQ